MNTTIMHINFAEPYGKKSIDDVCRMAAELGYDGIEFRGNPPQELEHLSFLEYAQQIAAGKKKYGLKEVLFALGLGRCTDPENRQANIAQVIEHAKIISDLCGTTVCNTSASVLTWAVNPQAGYECHGSAIATEEDWRLTVDAYQQVGYAVQPLGMKLGFETHMNYLHDLPVPAKKLVDMIDSPAIGINMDYGNTVYFPEKPSLEEAIDIYGDKLFYLHLKNSTWTSGGRISTALSDGEINHRAYLTKLKEVGFTGPIGLEAPRGGDRVWYAKQDLAYFKAVMADVTSK